MEPKPNLSLTSCVTLSSKHTMPLLGFGVFRNYDAKDAVLEALKAGYRHIDSAQVYYNEDQVGDAVRESGLRREDVFVTTKCCTPSQGYEMTKRGVDESLRKMNFDYIDLFLIHDPLSGKKVRLETYKALLEARDAGKIKSVGVSNFNVKHLQELEEAGLETPAVNQIELHPLCQQKEIVQYCTEHNIVVQAFCPLIKGKVENPTVLEVARKYNRDAAQILIRWSLQRGFIPLPKSAQPHRIHSNAAVYDFELADEDMRMLDGLDRGKEGAVSWNPVDAE